MNKTTTLNPNAEEFVPSFLKYAHVNAKSLDWTLLDAPGSSGKANLHQSSSSISNASDDEAHQCWKQQLPKNITPDFRVIKEAEMYGPQDLSLAGLSIHDGLQYSKFPTSLVNKTLVTRKVLSPETRENFCFSRRMEHNQSVFDEFEGLNVTVSSSVNSWGKPSLNVGQHSINRMEGHHVVGDYSTGLANGPIDKDLHIQDCTINPVEYLLEHFPGFAPQRLYEIYCANRGDLFSTIESLNTIKLQDDDDFNKNHNSKSLMDRNLSILDFPALLDADAQTELSKCIRQDSQHASNDYKTSSSLLICGMDFASNVNKPAFYDTDNWILGAADGVSIGSGRSSQILASSQNGHDRMNCGDKLLHGSSAAQAASLWFETGEAVGSREDARLGTACFQQDRESYLIASKALAKEPSLKGAVYSTQIEAAREKAREIAFHPRNSLGPELHSYGREQDHLIDLRGLHANEAIELVIDELSILRSTVRSTGRRMQITIWVGTGLHGKGSPTPAVLGVAVEQYLLDQGFIFTHPQPGLLRVSIY